MYVLTVSLAVGTLFISSGAHATTSDRDPAMVKEARAAIKRADASLTPGSADVEAGRRELRTKSCAWSRMQ